MYLFFSSLICAFASLAYAAPPKVQLGQTTVIGRDVTLLKQDFFGGIPFAQPPVGELRLRPPVLTTTLSGSTFDASNFGLSCFQRGVPTALISEDCLTINVFRPSGLSPKALLPVMFWTYGGGFTAGSSVSYNGSAIVAQSVTRGTPVIFVSFNYRLGPLGFPQGKEAANRGVLNLAMKDQLAALQWVNTNIGTFGGDKSKVTVFGESAGAIMTAALFLNSDLSKYARAAIMESGSAATSLTNNADRRESSWEKFVAGVPSCAASATGGQTFDCLKFSSSSDILEGVLASLDTPNEIFPFDPTIDGPGGLMPDYPSKLFQKGNFAKLPFIAGTNLDEGTAFASSATNSQTLLHSRLIANFSPPVTSASALENAIDTLTKLYPDIPALGCPFNTGNETFGFSSVVKQEAAIDGDLAFHSQRRLWMKTASDAGVKTFGYLFTEPSAVSSPARGVTHGSEVPFVFGAVANPTAAGGVLSSMMIDYWVSFATSLDPNDGRGTKRPEWAQYTARNEVIMQLNGANPMLIPDTYRSMQIDYINSNPLIFHH